MRCSMLRYTSSRFINNGVDYVRMLVDEWNCVTVDKGGEESRGKERIELGTSEQETEV